MGIVSLTENPKRNIRTVGSTEYVQIFLVRLFLGMLRRPSGGRPEKSMAVPCIRMEGHSALQSVSWCGIRIWDTGRCQRGKNKGAVLVKGRKLRHIFALELVSQDFYRDKEFTAGSTDLSITGKPAPGDNAVHVHMIIKFLVPCMEDLDDPGRCPEPFLSADSSRTVSAQHL